MRAEDVDGNTAGVHDAWRRYVDVIAPDGGPTATSRARTASSPVAGRKPADLAARVQAAIATGAPPGPPETSKPPRPGAGRGPSRAADITSRPVKGGILYPSPVPGLLRAGVAAFSPSRRPSATRLDPRSSLTPHGPPAHAGLVAVHCEHGLRRNPPKAALGHAEPDTQAGAAEKKYQRV
jgi:hypothetical protein